MKTTEYVCLSCGNNYKAAQPRFDKPEKSECPKCKSSNVIKLDPSRLFGFTSGGG
jgi:putative FmdB family regulatory protein